VHPHKPKPVHNWREFLKEYAIIVMGVLTALAAEQAAEAWHWHNKVADARAAIAGEMTINNHDFFARRIAIAPCLERQINQADAILSALEAGREPGKFAIFRAGSGSLLSDSEWQSERASQVLVHFPRAELAAMGRYYMMFQDFRPWMASEGEAWQELSILQNPPRGITTSDLIRLRVSLGDALRVERLIILNARRQLRLSKQLGIPGVQAESARVNAFCTLNEPDYQRFLRSQELR